MINNNDGFNYFNDQSRDPFFEKIKGKNYDTLKAYPMHIEIVIDKHGKPKEVNYGCDLPAHRHSKEVMRGTLVPDQIDEKYRDSVNWESLKSHC